VKQLKAIGVGSLFHHPDIEDVKDKRKIRFSTERHVGNAFKTLRFEVNYAQ